MCNKQSEHINEIIFIYIFTYNFLYIFFIDIIIIIYHTNYKIIRKPVGLLRFPLT
jgi:hypothetical protein